MFGGFGFGGGMPGGFPGGMPGGMGGRRARSGPPADTQKMYDQLGIKKTATQPEIRKAWKRKLVKEHPDRGGDEEKFKMTKMAYEILSDEQKRAVYDEGGLEAIKEQAEGGGGGGGDDMFSSLFGGGGRRRQQQQSGPQKGKPMVHKLRTTLVDLYCGKKRRLALTRKVIVARGSSDPVDPYELEQTWDRCETCRGQGAVLRVRQLGPGMIQQVQARCDKCAGAGYSLKSGFRQVEQREVLEVMIEKGMKDNSKIVMKGKGDMIPGQIPGDMVFVVDESEHDTYKRKNADLLMQKHISVTEAICGFAFTHEHMDGRTLLIKSEEGRVYSPGDLMCVEDEGMPLEGDHYNAGRLFILFKIDMPEPEDITAEQKTALLAILPPPEGAVVEEGDDMEIVSLSEVESSSFGKSGMATGRGAYDEDEEGDGRQVQCAQQ